MLRLEELVLPVQQLPREAFVRKYPEPVLVGSPSPQPMENDWRFRTQTLASGPMSVARVLAEGGLALAPEAAGKLVYPLRKSNENPWRERISVGRARNNDIVLLDSSVSKLHAYLRVEEPNPPDPRGQGVVTAQDAGSRNGTMVRGRKLCDGERAILTPGQNVVFGRVEMLYFDAGSLYDFIAKQVQPLNSKS